MDLIEKVDSVFMTLGEETQEQLSSFINFFKSAKSAGYVEHKTKNLILVSLAVHSECDWCIALQVQNAVGAGATREEIIESAWLAVILGGGPKLMHLKIVIDELERYFPSPSEGQKAES